MSTATTRQTLHGFEAIVLENDRLRTVILPSLGARVWELEDKCRARQWIWHRPDVPLAPAHIGATYDDVWAGGWEELFPNDASGLFEGRSLPDHGEWWTMHWTEVTPALRESNLRLEATSTVVRARCVKEFRLADATLSIDYSIRSLEDRPFHFLFKQHLPVAITPGCRLQLPGGRVEPVDAGFGTLAGGSSSFDWPGPTIGGHSLARIPPPAERHREFLYVRDLPQPWCGIVDPQQRASLRMDYDPTTFPYVWLFLTYGGWRDLYTAVLEPCTNLPKDLADAVRLGQSAVLEPGQEFSTTVTVRLAGMLGVVD